ncbi:MAG TPA: tetratricopeptide repeat protein, partial [Phycisphaerales bacterium]|nr:tetratricopeptide repeat protein [Phycisphaerales bacterium]
MSTRHARGNTTFLVVLAVIVCAVFVGVAAVGLKQARKSPQKLVALGDQQAQQNDYEKAVQYYSKAVNKDQTNPEWLERWVGAMEKTTPDSRDAYTERYAREYRPALLALAKAKGDGASYRRFLEETLQTLRAGDLKNLEGFVSLTDDLIKELPAEAPAVPTIRRFRGMGKVAMITPGVAPSAQEREQVEADLAAALAADPGDEEALVTLASLHRRLAAQHRQDRQDEAAQRELAAARKLLTDFAASHPHSPLALAELAALEMESARGTAARGAVTALPPEVSARVIEAVAAAPPEKLKPGVVAAAAGLARMLPEGGAERALEVYEAALAKRPGDAQIEFARASQLHSMGRSDEAAAAFKALAARPDLPLSLEGLNLFGLRELAALRHFDAVLAGWRPDLEPAGRAELLTRARAVRADLVGRVKDSAPVVTLIDAKLAYLEGEYAEATRLLSKYHKDTAGGDASSLLLLGEVQLRQGNTGAAREQFREAAKRSPSDVRAHLAVAGTELSMNDAEAARASYARVVELDPGNTEAAQKLALLDELSKGAQSSDVFVRAQSEVNQLLTRDPPDTAGALAKATAARDAHPDDARLAILLARLQVGSKDRPAARATLEQALARHPDHAGLKQMLAAVQGDDPTQAALAAVEQSGEPELIKHLQRYDIYGRAQRPDEALRELRAAEKLGPEHPAVVDALLHHAVGANDKAEVARLAQLGESKNLDKVGGVTYRARLAAFEQRYADALAMLRQAIEQDPMNPALHRFMGDVASRTGDHELAARSFREAVRARPSDPTSVRGLVGSLAALGRLDEALQAAREAQRTLGGDPEVQRLRLTLEEQAPGGDKALALSVRRRMAQSNPDDVPNRVSLAALAIRQGERELATRLVAELEGKADAAVMAELRATLAAAGGDVEGAKRVMQEHIASLPAERRTITPYFVLARVLEQAGRPEEALAAMEPARELQDPATRPVDQEMGALAFRARRYPEALTAFTRALEGVEKDPDNRLLKAVVQTQLLLGRFEEAERTVAQLGPAAEGDHQLAMLRGDAAAGRGDPERARRLYDDAAKLAPRDPMVFVRRAEFLMRQPDPGSLRD